MRLIMTYEGTKIYSVNENDQYSVTTSAAINDFIVINSDMFVLPDELIDIVILHEMGHIKLNHNNLNIGNDEYSLIRYLYTTHDKIIPIECEADDYMVCRIGKSKALEGMKELLNYLLTLYPEDSNTIKDFKLRIKRISKIPSFIYLIKSVLK